MAQIYATFGDTPGLTVSVIVRDKTDGSLDFSGTMTNLAGGLYFYEFVEVPGKSYSWIASVDAGGWTTAGGDLVEDSGSGGGGLTPEQATQLANTVKKGDTLLNLGDIILPL